MNFCCSHCIHKNFHFPPTPLLPHNPSLCYLIVSQEVHCVASMVPLLRLLTLSQNHKGQIYYHAAWQVKGPTELEANIQAFKTSGVQGSATWWPGMWMVEDLIKSITPLLGLTDDKCSLFTFPVCSINRLHTKYTYGSCIFYQPTPKILPPPPPLKKKKQSIYIRTT